MAAAAIFDRVFETSTTNIVGATTDLVVSGAVSAGYQTFGATVGNGNATPMAWWEVDGVGSPNGAWEVNDGSTYTAAGTKLSRGASTFRASSTGSPITSSSAAKRVAQSLPASIINGIANGTFIPGGRLTLTTAVPVTTADVTAAGTLFYTPYLHNRIRVYNGTDWVAKAFAEISLALTLTSGKNYDVFLDDDVLTLSLSAVWTNDTTRADALATQDSVTVLSSDHTKLWLGTIRASGSNTTEDSAVKRFVWNAYNRVARLLTKQDTTATWTYATNAWRQANTSAANQVEEVVGQSIDPIELNIHSICSGAGQSGQTAIGVNSTTAAAVNSLGSVGAVANGLGAGTAFGDAQATYRDYPRLGYSKFCWLEICTGGATITFYGDLVSTGLGYQSGIIGTIQA